ncbi:MAG TPA: glutaredoxin family protein [Bacillales bacterium]|nr:glutaredoxin family protein [Bacillales bacterium]
MIVHFYTKKGCPLCDEGKAITETLAREFAFEFKEIDIYEDDELLEQYQLMIPVVVADGTQLGFGKLSEQELRLAFQNLLSG